MEGEELMKKCRKSYFCTLAILAIWIGLLSLTLGCNSTEHTKLQQEATQVCIKYGGAPTKVDGVILVDCAWDFT